MTILFTISAIMILSVNHLYNSPFNSLFVSGVLALVSVLNLIDSNIQLNKLKQQQKELSRKLKK